MNKVKNKAAQALGKLSVEKRMPNMNKKQRSEYMKYVRAGKTPNIKTPNIDNMPKSIV